jgi:hypothetical protein
MLDFVNSGGDPLSSANVLGRGGGGGVLTSSDLPPGTLFRWTSRENLLHSQQQGGPVPIPLSGPGGLPGGSSNSLSASAGSLGGVSLGGASGGGGGVDPDDPQLFVALYDFMPAGDNQLSLRKGLYEFFYCLPRDYRYHTGFYEYFHLLVELTCHRKYFEWVECCAIWSLYMPRKQD